MTDVDVIIIGAGLAGAAAAKEVSRQGRNVVILEARDRVGGRGYLRAFGGNEEPLDFGGSWITPWQTGIRAACAEHGIALRPRSPVVERRWFRDGALHKDGPTSPHDRPQHERCIARIAIDAMLFKTGRDRDERGRDLTNISFADYLARIAAPSSTRDLCSAWWTVSGNGDHHRAPASEFLHSCSHSDGTPDGIIDVWSDTLVGGVTALVQRMIAASGVTLALNWPVSEVIQTTSGVSVRTSDGRTMRAKAATVCTGVNPLRSITFDPPLPPDRSVAGSRGHLGRAIKVWAKVRGVPVGVLATGGGSGIEWMFSERQTADGATMIAGFGLEGKGFDPTRSQDHAKALARFFPEAQLLAHDWHDWINDPYSRGTWVCAALDAPGALEFRNWTPTGRLAFASSDISPEGAGWFDAAIVSGQRAAKDIAEIAFH